MREKKTERAADRGTVRESESHSERERERTRLSRSFVSPLPKKERLVSGALNMKVERATPEAKARERERVRAYDFLRLAAAVPKKQWLVSGVLKMMLCACCGRYSDNGCCLDCVASVRCWASVGAPVMVVARARAYQASAVASLCVGGGRQGSTSE
jgi:hypothetical protein